jgi:dTDP-4-dehydrorhamnose 3,5-epimerase-like enzyme
MLEPKVQLQQLRVNGDHRGSLISLEGGDDFGFEISRVYYIFGTKNGVDRGFHAHKKLRQKLIAVNGSCTIDVEYKNKNESYTLGNPYEALSIFGPVWRVMKNFSNDCVLLVITDLIYDEEEYIRDYDEFKKLNEVWL